jgi:molybdopterin molybdotransferase
MLVFEAALERVLAEMPLLAVERVNLTHAHGRVLRETLRAIGPLPPFDYSAMDGYAVASAELTGSGPWTLPVRGESRAGSQPSKFVAGCACRIYTGAPVPPGADAVVMQEQVETQTDGQNTHARLSTRPAPGQNVRRRGEDLPAGEVALETGTRLGPHQLALCAAVDRSQILVARKPTVTIIPTGDELRRPGSTPKAASVPECNGISIAAMADWAGAVSRVREPVPDRSDPLVRALSEALLDSDLVVTIGGVSVGDHDLVRPALEELGVTLDFYKVKIKPGKPLVFGGTGQRKILGLPGNPASAQLTFRLFGIPALRVMQGEKNPQPRFQSMRLGAAIRQTPGRQGFYCASVRDQSAFVFANQSSGAITSLAWADALVVVPAESEGYEAGETVQVLMLGDRPSGTAGP